MKWTQFISQDFSFEFSGFYYTSNFLQSFRIGLHLKQIFYQTTPHKRSENLPFSRYLVTTERKRRGQGGVTWTEYNKRSDANYTGWIILIQSNTTHCAKLGLLRVQESDNDTFTAQVAAPSLFGGFSFHGLKKLKYGSDLSENTPI